MKPLKDDAVGRLAEIAGAYRLAFDAVQNHLQTLDLGEVSSWVFAIDQFDIVDLAEHDRELARLEQRRRQWRAALHAMAELAALHDDGPPPPGNPEHTLDLDDPDSPSAEDLAAITADIDPSGLPSLDRFISVVQYARSAGCMYVDGGFKPVVKGRKR